MSQKHINILMHVNFIEPVSKKGDNGIYAVLKIYVAT